MTHYGIAYGDLDGDGRPDITVANYNLHNTSIFINTSVPGLITFAPRVDLFVSLASMDVGIDDLDGDGRPDLAITKGGSTVSIFGNLCTLIPLPIELISFSAENKNNINHLTWTTTSETDNDYFEVERSADGINFETIGKVNGAGSTVQVKHYSFDDKKNIYGVIYYRLKQVDFNGNNKYSAIISIENKRQDIFCSVNPTDVNGIFILHCSELNSASIKLLDTEGKEIAEKEMC
ncbi:MAG: VCBS repeat-containing protein [Bacteroidetes bacterium]|nr:VCBS repeat-containing protein [Bacteroidota bacterium]